MQPLKKDFPILATMAHDRPLVFLDSAASAQKPQCVIAAINDYYAKHHANIHRGVYQLSAHATELYEAGRERVRQFINAKETKEIIFNRGATEGINCIAQSYGRKFLTAGDEVLLSVMEHHANIVPWLMLRDTLGITIKTIPMLDNGEIDLDAYKKLLNPRTKIVGLIHASNVLGTINPIKEMVTLAHAQNAVVVVDGAQAVPHLPVDVQALDCDFYVFSSHKVYGPTGLGVLYGKSALLSAMPPYQGGGDMISTVSFERATYKDIPYRFEAGTPHIAGVIGLHAALDYVSAIGFAEIMRHEQELLHDATAQLQKIPGLKILGTAPQKMGVISFVLDGIHPHDLGTILDLNGIAVRTGHHCAMPLMQHLNIPACTRASFGVYSTKQDIAALIAGIQTAQRIFNHG